MTCGIYAITFCGRNRIYIGQSKNIERRWEEHTSDLENDRHANVKMKSLWRKFGSTMRFHILEVCKPEELDRKEQILIDCMFASHKQNLINLQRTVNKPPGFKSRKHTEASKAIMRARKIGRSFSDEHRAKMSASNKGQIAWNKGKQHSAETRARISNSLIGKQHSEEHRAKISAAQKLRHERRRQQTENLNG